MYVCICVTAFFLYEVVSKQTLSTIDKKTQKTRKNRKKNRERNSETPTINQTKNEELKKLENAPEKSKKLSKCLRSTIVSLQIHSREDAGTVSQVSFCFFGDNCTHICRRKKIQ